MMPARSGEYLSPIIICQKRKDAFEIAREVGGLFRPFGFCAN